MSEPRWPDDLLVRSFAPRRNPLPAPDTDIFDEPRACAKLNFKWFSHVLGALETLTQPDAWAGDDTDIFDAQQQIEQLIEQLSSECEQSLIDVFGPTMPSFATWAAQFLADYGALPVIDPWNALGQTLAYGSADDPTYTATCSGVDLTSVLSVGMKIRVSQATGGTKYFIITKIAFATNTTITLYGGTDYDLNNETVSNPCYSVAKAPYGFPQNPAKWTIEVIDTGNRNQGSPTSGTWYNVGSVSIVCPIGAWRVLYEVAIDMDRPTAGDMQQYSTLSTANNSESEPKLTCTLSVANASRVRASLMREYRLNLTAKTTYYLNAKAGSGSHSTISHRGDVAPTIINFICAYL